MLDLVTLGDIKQDIFVTIPEASVQCTLKSQECKICLDYGHKIPTSHFFSQVAGTAPNVARAGARLGLKTSVISTVGGEWANAVKRTLREDGVSTRHLQYRADSQNAQAIVLTFKAESTQLVSQADLPLKLPSPLPRTKILHLSELGANYHALFLEILNWKKSIPDLKLSFNPGAVQLKERKPIFLKLLEQTDILFVNTVEARKILQVASGSPARLTAKLQEITGRTVCVTDGEHGAFASDGRDTWYAPMFPGKRVETTGAGDAFAGGVLASLGRDQSLQEALGVGSILAASVVGQLGPTAGLLSAREVKERLQAHPRYRVQPV
jgi:sugar/nucleoside kinase (ribokinase family)